MPDYPTPANDKQKHVTNVNSKIILPDKLSKLLSIYLSQNIIRPIDIEPAQLAYRWVGGVHGKLVPIEVNSALKLTDLQGIDIQKEKIEQNTKQFLAGFPANHVLLTGTRGSGKSSLIRALLNTYHEYGLRIIEVSRDDLLMLNKIREAISYLPRGHGCRYIIYCDDLAFDKQDENYRTLKSVLDGSLDSEQEQLLVYATSNRRHLLPQMMKDNINIYDGQTDEVNPLETIDETVSLSDRFGLWLSFHPMKLKDYLQIAQHYIEASGVEWTADVKDTANRWASERGGYSGRIAYQFSRQYIGTVKLSEKQELDKQKQVHIVTQRKIPLLKQEQIDKLFSGASVEGQFGNAQIFIAVFVVALVLAVIFVLITGLFSIG